MALLSLQSDVGPQGPAPLDDKHNAVSFVLKVLPIRSVNRNGLPGSATLLTKFFKGLLENMTKDAFAFPWLIDATL